MTGRRYWIYMFNLIAVGLLPTVHSYCFKTYKVRSDNTFRCRSRVNDDPGSFEHCCSVEGSVGYSTSYKGWNCQVCEAALSEEELPPVWSEWGEFSACSRTCDWGVRIRERTCDQGICDGPTSEQEDCIEAQDCPVDGNWGSWGAWSSCSKTCSVGIRSRRRECNNPPPQHNGRTCLAIGGDSVEQGNCVEVENCPINGNWGNWQPYSPCSTTCGGDATRTRERACDNPPAQYGGLECEGVNKETINCGLGPCPIDGKWGDWSPWSGCSKTCGDGKSVRKRSCNRPKPQYNGKPCTGDDTEKKTCNKGKCVEIVDWTNWSKWSPCEDCIKYNEQRRTRSCPIQLDTKIIKCEGSPIEFHKCLSLAECKIDEEGSGSGDGCIGDDCCDDIDGCPENSESESASFSSSNAKPPPPLPTRCRTVVNTVAGNGGGIDSDSVSVSSNSVSQSSSVSEGGKEGEQSFIWVDCPEVTPTPTPEDDCRDSNSNNCAFSDYYDYSDESSSETTPKPADESSSSLSDYEAESSQSAKSSESENSSNNDSSEGSKSYSDYGSSLKVDNNNKGGGGGANGPFSSFSSL